jgi:hypothetical protein
MFRVSHRIVPLFTAVLLVASGSAVAERPADLILVAHRGIVTETLTENSLPSLEETIRRGYTHVEVDIRCTKDGQAVCLHDSSLKRTTGIDARIHEVTLTELRKLVDADTVPSLEEFCARAAGRIDLMPDIKDCPPDLVEALAASIRDAMSRHGLLKNALFIGRHDYVKPEVGEGRVSTRGTVDFVHKQSADDPAFSKKHFVFGHAVDFNAENVRAFREMGLPVVVSINLFHYTSGDPVQQGLDDVQKMMVLRVDGLQIDAEYDAGLARE